MQYGKLRIGLLLDSFDTAAWSYKMIEIIMQSYYAEVDLVVINDAPKEKRNKTIMSKLRNNYGRINYLAIRKFLEVLYNNIVERHAYVPNAIEQRDLRYLIKNIPAINVKPIQKQWSDYLRKEDISQIKTYNIDIFVRCGFRILRGDILNCAKYGIWSFHHGDNYVLRGGPACFWESMENWPETGSILQILTEDLDNGKVLYRSFSCTDSMSIKDNLSNCFWKSLSFMTRKMEELYNKGEKEFFKEVDYFNRHPIFYSNRLYATPTNYELFKLTFSKIIQKAKVLFKNKFFFEQWFLMYDLKNNYSLSLWRYKKMMPPKDRDWADPHIVFKDNKYYIFLEEYLYKTQKGHISLIVMDEKGVYQDPVIILDKPYHLSYPFVFEYKNEFYMIPETMLNNTIELYKCIDFPNKWEWQMNLMENIRAVDATVFYHKGKWWMFTSIVENEGPCSSDELFLFYSENLLSSQWKSHPRNPIVSDCKTARPAGKIFEIDGRLYRPSQNCSVRYGYGFNINYIELLDEYNYKEETISKVEPKWDKNIIGTHTFNHVNSLHIIDVNMRRRR